MVPSKRVLYQETARSEARGFPQDLKARWIAANRAEIAIKLEDLRNRANLEAIRGGRA